MQCPYCGKKQPGKNEFCMECGIRLPRRTAGMLLRSWGKRLLAALRRHPLRALAVTAGVLAAAAAVWAVLTFLVPPKYSAAEHFYRFIYNSDREETSVVFDDRALPAAVSGRISHYELSFDGRVAAVLTEAGVLYEARNGSLTTLGENVTEFTLSQNGKSVILRFTDGTIQMIRGGSRIHIADEAGERFCVSPDGRTVAYTSASTQSIYTTDGKRTVRQDCTGTPIAVSDRGRYLYYYRQTEEGSYLFVNERQLSSDASAACFALNLSQSQFWFVAGGENELTLYLTEKGSAPSPVVSVTRPSDIPLALHRNASYMTRSAGSAQVITVGVSDFAGKQVRIGSSLYLLGDGTKVQKTAEADLSLGVFLDDSYLYFVRAGTDTLCRAGAGDPQNAESLVSGITGYAVSEAGSRNFYYLDAERTLYYVPGRMDKASAVRREVTSLQTVGKRCVFMNADGFLYSVRGRRSELLIREDVSSLTRAGRTVFYECNRAGVRTVLASLDGKSFREVYEGPLRPSPAG